MWKWWPKMRQSEIALLLPVVFQRTVTEGSLLAALLAVMDDLHAPAEQTLAELDAYFDPRRTTEGGLLMLARWVDLDWLVATDTVDLRGTDSILPGGTGTLRELVA